MNSINKLCFCLPLGTLLLTMACQPKTKEKVVTPAPWYQGNPSIMNENFADAEELRLQGSSCFRGQSFPGITDIMTGSRQTDTIDITYDLTLSPLTDITKTHSQSDLIGSGVDVFLCQSDYPANSIEYVAQKVANEISFSYDWYQQTTSKDLDIPEIKLEIHPLMLQDIYIRYSDRAKRFLQSAEIDLDTTPRHIEADSVYNAFWSFDRDGDSVISFLPHPKRTSLAISEMPTPLWDLPFVARHEYGHHVFFHHMSDLLNDPDVDYRGQLADHPTLHTTQKKPEFFSKTLLESKAPVSRIDSFFLLAATNEGFADLFSYYASNETMPGIENAPCMLKTRDPSSANMQGWLTEKRWSKAFVNYLFDTNAQPNLRPNHTEDDSCAAFNLGSPHALGAVIAYTVDQVFSSSDLLVSAKNPNQIKAKLALNWLDRLNRELNMADMGPRPLMAKILSSAFDVVAEDQQDLTLNAKSCRLVDELFSGWQEIWQPQQGSLSTCQ